MWWKYSHADLTSVWDPLTCWIPKGVLKQCFFLESKITKFFTAWKPRNKVAMTIIFFPKSLKYYIDSENGLKKNQKKFFVFKLIAFESGSTNSLNLEKDTCHWQSMCYETSLRFKISLWDIFFKSGSIRVMEKYHESVLIQILQGFGTL